MSDAVRCPWCTRLFRPRRGGHAQLYCRPPCRRASHAAARRWVLDAIANGASTVADTKNGLPETRTLQRCEAPSPSGITRLTACELRHASGLPF
jgi:hypothetical protein